jgi:hypothetical protein
MPAVSLIGRCFASGAVTTAATSITRTSALAVGVGNAIIVAHRGQQGIYVTAVSDSAGNTYTLVGQTTSGNTASVYCAIVTTAITTSTTFTLTLSGTNVSSAFGVVAFANVDPINPIGSTVTGSATSVLDLTITSAVPNRYGSMLLTVPTVNDGTRPTITAGSVSVVAMVTFAEFMSFGYRQNDDLLPYSVTYRRAAGSAGNWGYVMAEINRVPSDFFNVF